MCKFLSVVYTKDRKVLWYENNSHTEIIERTGLKDTTLENREFVRIELLDGKLKNFSVDETGTLPAWYSESKAIRDIKNMLPTILTALATYDKTIATAREAYDKTTATALEAYDKTTAPARKTYYKTIATAQEAYDKTIAPALEAYYKTIAPARKTYDKTIATAQEAYDKTIATAREAYDKAIVKARKNLETVKGYCKKI